MLHPKCTQETFLKYIKDCRIPKRVLKSKLMSFLYPEKIVGHEGNLLNQLLLQDHIKRYKFASKLVKHAKVLDIACGNGYGTNILSKSAKSVVGVDISKEAIDFATKKYENKNVEFYQSDAKSLNFSASSFEYVVSFETIEHLSKEGAKEFLEEIKRVLKPSGKLIISTPDNRNASLGKKPANPYHLQEYSLVEFKNLVSDYFEIINIYGQSFTNKSQIEFVKIFAISILKKPVQIAWRIYQKLHIYTGTISEYHNENKIPWVNIIYAFKPRNIM